MRQWRWPEADGEGGYLSWPEYLHPEATGGLWKIGDPYQLDAIIGMGEDEHSVGEWCDALTEGEARDFAVALGVNFEAERDARPPA